MTSTLQNRIPSPLGTPRRSPAPCRDDNQSMTPRRLSIDNHVTPRRSTAGINGARARDLSGFSTLQRVTVMGREHDWVEFRTPQHPTSGTNNWGGGSPMLARNIPKESLMIDYLKFNTLDDDDADYDFETDKKDGDVVKRKKRSWVFRKFGWKKKEEKALGSTVAKKKKKGSWLSRGWPQGWW